MKRRLFALGVLFVVASARLHAAQPDIVVADFEGDTSPGTDASYRF